LTEIWLIAFLQHLTDRNCLSVCPSFCLSVALSVTRVFCDETKEHTAEMLTPHERVITLVFCYQKRLVGDVSFHLKFALKVTHPLEKCGLRPISAYNVSTARASEKCSIIANSKSTTFSSTKGWRGLSAIAELLVVILVHLFNADALLILCRSDAIWWRQVWRPSQYCLSLGLYTQLLHKYG